QCRLSQETINQESQTGISYSCGSPILPEDHSLFNQLHIHQNITCDSSIEQNYYSSRLKVKTIYPLFALCYTNDRESSTRAPSVFRAKNKK
ncbi:19972_t:CDS:2, partial [Gigaspora rosea]